MTVFALVMLPALVALGFWQLERAEEKRALIEDFLREQNALAELPGAEISNVAFKRLRLVGRYEPGRYFLVDNQVRRGLNGYAVVASFLTRDGRRWLVNRGWVAAPVSRDQFPEIESPEGVQTDVVMLWPDLGLIPLAGRDPWSSVWPKRVQRLNVARMASQLEIVVAREVRL